MMLVFAAVMFATLAGAMAYLATDQRRPYIIWICFILSFCGLLGSAFTGLEARPDGARPTLLQMAVVIIWMGFLFLALIGLCARLIKGLADSRTAITGATVLGFLLPFLVIYSGGAGGLMFFVFMALVLFALWVKKRIVSRGSGSLK
jgi:hypothetical protein